MIILKPYNDSDFNAVNQYFPAKEIAKYINKGKYRLLSLLGIYRSTFMLLEENGQIMGCGVMRRKWSRNLHKFGWWLYAIWIEPSQRCKGISKILMNKLLEELKKKNIETVHLTVSKDNEIAQNLYNKIGFKLEGENSTDYIMRYDL